MSNQIRVYEKGTNKYFEYSCVADFYESFGDQEAATILNGVHPTLYAVYPDKIEDDEEGVRDIIDEMIDLERTFGMVA